MSNKQIPIRNGKRHYIVNLVLDYIDENNFKQENPVTYGKVNKALKKLVAGIVSIEIWKQEHPTRQWKEGIAQREFYIETLEWCIDKLKLSKSQVRKYFFLIRGGFEKRKNK